MSRLVYRRMLVRGLIHVFDGCSGALATVWEKRRRSPSEVPRRWLLVQLHHVGDVVLSTSVLNALRAARPKDHIAMLVTPWTEPLLRGQAALDEIVVHEASWRRRSTGRKVPGLGEWSKLVKQLSLRSDEVFVDLAGDLFVNLLGAAAGFPRRWGFSGFGGARFLDRAVPVSTDRPQREQWERLFEPIGLSVQSSSPSILLSCEEREGARRRLASPGPALGLHVGGGRPEKQISIDWLTDWARRAGRHGWRVVLLGSESERLRAAAVQTIVPSASMDGIGGNLRTFAARIGALQAFVGPDSGSAHLAAAQDVPAWVIFESSLDRKRWCPPGVAQAVDRDELDEQAAGRSIDAFLESLHEGNGEVGS